MTTSLRSFLGELRDGGELAKIGGLTDWKSGFIIELRNFANLARIPKRGKMIMVSSKEAGRLLGGLSSEAIRQYAEGGLLPYTRRGIKGIYQFNLDEVRNFAAQRDRYFDHELANQLISRRTQQ